MSSRISPPWLACARAVPVPASNIPIPPAAFRSALEDAGIGVEVMNSPAACRTYNVLLSEGRRIAVALLPVTPAAG